MPEGDAIHAISRRLQPLVGKTIRRVTTQGLVRDLASRTVTDVAAHGKHLTITLDDGTYLRAHLGMNGRFRLYGRDEGEALLGRMSPGRVTLAIVTDDLVHLWVGARTIEISSRRAPGHGMATSTLGPDILADDFDSRLAASRAALHESRRIADVLLDQRIVAGIGNIYKNESLFLEGIDPRTTVSAIERDQLEVLFSTARTLMQRRSRDFFVYSRTNQRCRRCETAIECRQLGDPPRWTWWCGTCQRQLEQPGTLGGVG